MPIKNSQNISLTSVEKNLDDIVKEQLIRNGFDERSDSLSKMYVEAS